jgi:PAS domain S-box-containing protein
LATQALSRSELASEERRTLTGQAWGYVTAVASVAAVVLFKIIAGEPLTGTAPFLLLFAPIVVSAVIGGVGPALLATALAAAASTLFIGQHAASVGLLVAVFAAEGVLLSILSVSLQRARDRAEHSAREARRDRAALELSEERIALLVDNVTDYAIYFLHPDGTVASWNAGAERLKAYKAEQVLGQHVSIFYTPKEREEGKPRRDLEIAAREGSYREEVLRHRLDGATFWADITLTSLRSPSGELRGFAKITRDVTAQKHAEQALRAVNEQLEQRVAERTAELTAANRELEAFSYSVSHDLRAPLRGIEGFSKLLAERYTHLLDDQARHYLERVRTATQRMAQLIDELLRLSRITRAQLRRAPFDLGQLAKDIAAEVQRQEPQRPVQWRLQAPLPATADPQLVRILLENLLGNAWKFTRDQHPPVIELGAEEVEGRLAYFVRDNGVGFDMAYADKLFAPFQRLHDANEFEGTGIGLATVSRIVTRHGGAVWATGEPGRGATIWFSLGET